MKDNKIIEEIRKYNDLINDETSAFIDSAIETYDFAQTAQEDGVCLVIIESLERHLDWYKENTKIIEEKTTKEIITKKLEYL